MESQRRIASELMKCGVSRVRIKSAKEVGEALTRNDIRELIKKGDIYKIRKKGTCRASSKKRLHQKEKGRRKGFGSRKGKAGARSPRKRSWIISVRAQRKLLMELRDSGRIDKDVYRQIYLRIKGGSFRNKSHFMYYLKEHDYLKKLKAPAKAKKSSKEIKN